MPRRVETFKPPWARRRQADSERPTAAQRGYCTKAWQMTRLAVIARDEGVCQLCGCIVAGPRQAQVDHIRPKAEGGSDAMGNLRLLCLSCHSRRTARDNR